MRSLVKSWRSGEPGDVNGSYLTWLLRDLLTGRGKRMEAVRIRLDPLGGLAPCRRQCRGSSSLLRCTGKACDKRPTQSCVFSDVSTKPA